MSPLLSAEPKTIVFVLGYGRSGTSIVINLLGHLVGVDAHGELSKSFMRDYLLDDERFKKHVDRARVPVVAAKPILNSYRVGELLESFPRSRVIWMYRHYADVTNSAIRKFGDSVRLMLKEYIESRTGENWISTQLPTSATEAISTLPTSTLSPADWTALVWWSVNHALTSSDLPKRQDVMVTSYEALTADPERVLGRMMGFIGRRPDQLHRYVDASHSSIVGRVHLTPQVEDLCRDMMARLHSCSNIPDLS